MDLVKIKSLLLLLYFMVPTGLFSQEGKLILEHTKTGKIREIKENKRIKIKTVEGGKLVGRLQIIDNNTIRLRYVTIPLNEIEKVKRHPVGATIGNAVGFVALGLATFVFGELMANPPFGGGKNSAAWRYIGTGLSIGAIYASTQPINFVNKGYDLDREWKFRIAMDN